MKTRPGRVTPTHSGQRSASPPEHRAGREPPRAPRATAPTRGRRPRQPRRGALLEARSLARPLTGWWSRDGGRILPPLPRKGPAARVDRVQRSRSSRSTESTYAWTASTDWHSQRQVTSRARRAWLSQAEYPAAHRIAFSRSFPGFAPNPSSPPRGRPSSVGSPGIEERGLRPHLRRPRGPRSHDTSEADGTVGPRAPRRRPL
jgi:hypothetical protein